LKYDVKAKFKCPISSKVEMSGFDFEFLIFLSVFEIAAAIAEYLLMTMQFSLPQNFLAG